MYVYMYTSIQYLGGEQEICDFFAEIPAKNHQAMANVELTAGQVKTVEYTEKRQVNSLCVCELTETTKKHSKAGKRILPIDEGH